MKPIEIAHVDFDGALYLGSSEDGVYFDAAEGKNGWYVSAVVDCNSGHFCQPITADDGPYANQGVAMLAGISAAYDWLVTNHVRGWRKDYARYSSKYRTMDKREQAKRAKAEADARNDRNQEKHACQNCGERFTEEQLINPIP